MYVHVHVEYNVLIICSSITVEDGMSVWWLQDTVFHEPTLNIYCDINSPQTKYSMYDPQWTGMINLLVYHTLFKLCKM